MKVSGITAVQTYIEWSSHQPQPDQFIFSGKKYKIDYIIFYKVDF